MYHWETKNIAKKLKFCKNYILRNINSVTRRSQKNYKILLKLSKKNIFLGPNWGLNCPLWLSQRINRYYHIVYNKNISLPILNAKFRFLCICCSRIYQEEALRFFGIEPNCAHFGGF